MDYNGKIWHHHSELTDIGIKYSSLFASNVLLRGNIYNYILNQIKKQSNVQFYYYHKLLNIIANHNNNNDRQLSLEFIVDNYYPNKYKRVNNYDLIIGCDGVCSTVRSIMYPEIINKNLSNKYGYKVFNDVDLFHCYAILTSIDINCNDREINYQLFNDYKWFEYHFINNKDAIFVNSKHLTLLLTYVKVNSKFVFGMMIDRKKFESDMINLKIVDNFNDIHNIETLKLKNYCINIVQNNINIEFVKNIITKANWDNNKNDGINKNTYVWNIHEINNEKMMKHKSYKSGILLMGDSDHAMLPFQAQGLNQILEDVLRLKQQLLLSFNENQNNDMKTLEQAFEHYEKIRKPIHYKIKKTDVGFKLSVTPMLYYINKIMLSYILPLSVFRKNQNNCIQMFCHTNNLSLFDVSFVSFYIKITIIVLFLILSLIILFKNMF
jgi:hypothetical protein